METPKELSLLEERLGHTFKDKSWLAQATMQESYFTEHPELTWRSDTRLDYLGDAVIELIVRTYIISHHAKHKARIVSNKNLSKIAGILNLDYIIKDCEPTGAPDSERAMATILEAIVGAIYNDGGLEAAEKFVGNTILASHNLPQPLTTYVPPRTRTLTKPDKIKRQTDQSYGLPNVQLAKKLREDFTKQYHCTPTYKLVSYQTSRSLGEQRKFVVNVYAGNEFLATGKGETKKTAHRAALAAALALKQT